MSEVESSTSVPESLRVYVNERGVSVPHGSVAVDAVRALDSELAREVEAGRMRLTDSRGLPVDGAQSLVGGAIYRVVPVRESHGVVADASGVAETT